MMEKQYETVIGLEVHVELASATKIFCGCSTKFGGAPNTHTCPVCTGMPGSLPVLNKQVVEYALALGLAANCGINQHCRFDRKNYFYPDNPQNYQISQLYVPICHDGWLMVDTSVGQKKIRIHEMHMEEDAGKLIHDEWEDCSLVDYNRSGVPLVEIVSEPDMRSSAEAVAYLKALYGIVTYLGVCDGNMEEGSFRCDANVSIRPVGSTTFGTRTELKNLNSFRNVQRAIDYEIARQQDALADGEEIVQETRLYDATKNITASMRGKEEAHDYRYFPDPDLLPVTITDEEFSRWQQELPELPAARMQRFITMTGLPEPEAEVLVQSRAMADFFEAAAAKADARKVANFILGPLLRELNARSLHVQDCAMTPEALAELVSIVDKGLISAKIANDIFADLMENGAMPEAYVKEKGLVQISDSSALEAAVDKVLADNPAEVEAFRGGKTKLISFFVGQVMRATRGKANPALVNELLAKKLAG